VVCQHQASRTILRRDLHSGAPGAIAPASLAVDGTTVTWTQNGERLSASA
jgi:hypothetical protein